jgi:DNA-binding response OmpR family regulator
MLNCHQQRQSHEHTRPHRPVEPDAGQATRPLQAGAPLCCRVYLAIRSGPGVAWKAGTGRELFVSVGGAMFEPSSGRLVSAGGDVTLRPKTATVLEVLVARAGEVVTREQLLRSVWPEGYVSDAVLSVCVNELRTALGDHADAPRFIATVHRRGYRLVAPVAAPAA